MLGSLSHLHASLRGKDLVQKSSVCEPPLRSELFSRDQMEQHGKTLAATHKLNPNGAPDQLLARLAENEGHPDRYPHPSDGGGHD